MEVKGKSFEVLINEEDLQARIKELANQINEDFKDKEPLFIGILNGCFMFVSDIMKEVNLPSKISFIKVASYTEMVSSGAVKELIGLNENIFKKDVIILEDIIDSGNTIASVSAEFKDRGASSVTIATLLLKPEALKTDINIQYVGFEITNEFVIGYGLDYDGLGRNTREIYQLKS